MDPNICPRGKRHMYKVMEQSGKGSSMDLRISRLGMGLGFNNVRKRYLSFRRCIQKISPNKEDLRRDQWNLTLLRFLWFNMLLKIVSMNINRSKHKLMVMNVVKDNKLWVLINVFFKLLKKSKINYKIFKTKLKILISWSNIYKQKFQKTKIFLGKF